ncbi:MAG TPA: hypothetical protein VD866_10990 [Urbifossiella sp.]|nr:hypothetical protein [Urbifossiella sp.]
MELSPDHEYCRALIDRYVKALLHALGESDSAAMRFCQRRLAVLNEWQRELTEAPAADL